MFISVTDREGTRMFAAELYGIATDHDYIYYNPSSQFYVYGPEGTSCIVAFKSAAACKATMDQVLQAINTGAGSVEIAADAVGFPDWM